MAGQHRIRADNVTWQRVDDEIVVLDLAGSKYLALNGTAALLWTAIEDGRDDEALAELLVEQFDLPREQAVSDVSAFLAHGVQVGILE